MFLFQIRICSPTVYVYTIPHIPFLFHSPLLSSALLSCLVLVSPLFPNHFLPEQSQYSPHVIRPENQDLIDSHRLPYQPGAI